MLRDYFGLTGKRALVTGGTSGIGLAITRALTAAGAQVVTVSDRADDVAALDIPAATGLVHRLSDRQSALDLVDRAAAILGGIDILVSNAGIEGPVGATGAGSEVDYLRTFDINLHSPYWLAAAVAPMMAAGGSIVLMASLSAMRGNRAIGPYAMTKAAMAQLARNLAVEFGPQNIRANAIAPGLIDTPFSAALLRNEAFMARRLAATPLRRVGTPDEIAGAVLWLCGPSGGFMTGQTVVIDGGTLVSDGS